MPYITLNDIFDEVLTCTDEDITVGNDTIAREARRLHAKIVEPVAPIIKRLGVCAACCNRCLMQAGTDPTTTFNGANGVEYSDVYAQKLKMYRTEMDRIISALTAEDFGAMGGRARYSIPLYRS